MTDNPQPEQVPVRADLIFPAAELGSAVARLIDHDTDHPSDAESGDGDE